MTNETLRCEDGCGKTWERPLTRGRKPKQCPECKDAPVKTVPKVVSESKFKEIELQHKAKVKIKGDIRFLGEPEPFKKLTIYSGWETSDAIILSGSFVRITGFADRYRVTNVAVRQDGTAYANLVGVSGAYEGKYRAIGITELRRS